MICKYGNTYVAYRLSNIMRFPLRALFHNTAVDAIGNFLRKAVNYSGNVHSLSCPYALLFNFLLARITRVKQGLLYFVNAQSYILNKISVIFLLQNDVVLLPVLKKPQCIVRAVKVSKLLNKINA